MPEFETLSLENNKVKVRLICLDEVEELNGSVKLLLQKRRLLPKCFCWMKLILISSFQKLDISEPGQFQQQLLLTARNTFTKRNLKKEN